VTIAEEKGSVDSGNNDITEEGSVDSRNNNNREERENLAQLENATPPPERQENQPPRRANNAKATRRPTSYSKKGNVYTRTFRQHHRR
jgi:hypothetical protein